MTSGPPPMPIPVATLAYQPPERQRPGIMTAVGVISIVLACLSGLASLGGVFSNLGMLMLSRISIPMPATPLPTSAPGTSSMLTVTVDGPTVSPDGSPDGMEPEQRGKVIQAITDIRAMNAPRTELLDPLLQNSGQKMFPSVGETTTAAEIRQKISWRNTGPSIDYIHIPTGVIEESDKTATFRPQGAGEIVRVASRATQSATTLPTFATTPFPFKMSASGAILGICEDLASLVIAIFLLVGGILLLRSSPTYLRLHWIYILAKIPLACVAAVAYWINYTSMMSSMTATLPPGASPPAWGSVMLFPTIMWALIAVAYPISLIFVFASRTAKSYYDEVRGIRG